MAVGRPGGEAVPVYRRFRYNPGVAPSLSPSTPVKHRIDPKIDCVFKALLGSEENRNLLIHFINAVLGGELMAPIGQAGIINPYNEKGFVTDKLSVVDVKARDALGRLFQIEIQMLSYPHLPARIFYTWADLYVHPLESGQDYDQLEPVYAIWLLDQNLVRDDGAYARHYKLRDQRGRSLLEHGGVWLLELGKFAVEQVETEEQRWLKLFKDGGRLDEGALPDWMNTREMRQAMETLKRFSEKDENYFAYQARENFLREQRTIAKRLAEAERIEQEAERREREAEQERLAWEQAMARERREKDAALAEIQRLKALLERG
jgi:predicted transposase/invertase (TIGR01784 family)